MKTYLITLSMFLATNGSAQQKEFPLWPKGAPGALGTTSRDIPTLTPYLAPQKTNAGSAIVVCPGGGYGGPAVHEGRDYALFLNQHGVNAFVLKYRLGSAGYRHPIMLGDAARALRTVRKQAGKWSIDPNRIGIMGSSAGGHLASTLITQFDPGDPEAKDPVDRQSSRPNAGILCYPVVTMGEFTHRGSQRNLLGDKPSQKLMRLLSNELHVKHNTPPTFIWHTMEDRAVKVENSLQLASALRKAAVPFALHIYQKGRHGIGLADKPPFNHPHPWAGDLVFWLRAQGFLPVVGRSK